MTKNKKNKNRGNKKVEEIPEQSHHSNENENIGNESNVVAETDENAYLRRENKLLMEKNANLETECKSLKEMIMKLQEEIKMQKESIKGFTSGCSNNNSNNENWNTGTMDIDCEDLAKFTNDETSNDYCAGASAIVGYSGISDTPQESLPAEDTKGHLSDLKLREASKNFSRSKNSYQDFNQPQHSTYQENRRNHGYDKSWKEGSEHFQGRGGRNYRSEGRQRNSETNACSQTRQYYDFNTDFRRHKRSEHDRDGEKHAKWEADTCNDQKFSREGKESDEKGALRTQRHNDSTGLRYTQQKWYRDGGQQRRYGGPNENFFPNPKVVEKNGDLFEAPKDHSLAHCVGEDLRMGSGIAVQFKQQFKKVDELLGQRKKVGQVAVLHEDNRYIYYLVTKKYSTGKPRLNDLEAALCDMKKHVEMNDVRNIAIPRIGCGLDRLDWKDVHYLLETIFEDVNVTITVHNFTVDGIHNFNISEEVSEVQSPDITITEIDLPVSDLEYHTVYLSTAGPSTAGLITAGPSTAGPSTADLITAALSTAGSSTADRSVAGPSTVNESVAGSSPLNSISVPCTNKAKKQKTGTSSPDEILNKISNAIDSIRERKKRSNWEIFGDFVGVSIANLQNPERAALRIMHVLNEMAEEEKNG